MMPEEWQVNDLTENVKLLSKFRAYRPIFAVPFGREQDWTAETLCIARNRGLDVVLADGGINVAPGPSYRRIPSDSGKLGRLVSAAMARRQSVWPLAIKSGNFVQPKSGASPT